MLRPSSLPLIKLCQLFALPEPAELHQREHRLIIIMPELPAARRDLRSEDVLMKNGGSNMPDQIKTGQQIEGHRKRPFLGGRGGVGCSASGGKG